MSANQAVKILVAGDVAGNFDKLFTRAAKLHQQHQFAALLCVGTFFSKTPDGNKELMPYITGEKEVPLDTYFIAGNECQENTELIDKIPNGGTLCKNLTYLGRQGARFIGGLTVGYLSGVYDPVNYRDTSNAARRNIKYYPYYIESDVQALMKHPALTKGVDMLLTAEWGRGFHTLLPASAIPASLGPAAAVGSPVIAELASVATARYHFAGTQDVFFQLPPYRNQVFYTRFIGLASIGTKGKDRSMYACNITPFSALSYTDRNTYPADITPCPYTAAVGAPTVAAASSDAAGEEPVAKRARVEGVPSRSSADSAKIAALQEQKRIEKMAQWAAEEEARQEAAGGYNPWGISAVPDRKMPPVNYICNICRQPGHYIQDCPQKGDRRGQKRHRDESGGGSGERRPPPDHYVCHRCNQPGHWIQDCPSKQQGGSTRGEKVPPEGYVCKNCGKPGHYFRLCPTLPPRKGEVELKECWFCLASPNVAAHLIVSVGDEFYLARDKGALVDEHVLILPITHVADTTQLSEAGALELEKYKVSLIQYFGSKNQAVIFCERNIPTRAQQHTFVQAVPIPRELEEKAASFILNEARALDIDFKPIPSNKTLKQVASGRPYVYFELPDGTRLLHLVGDGRKPGLFDFARAVLAKLLGMPHRADWRQCQVSQEEETAAVERMKDAFKDYDFTLEAAAGGDE